MAKKEIKEQLDNVPEEKQKPLSKKDKVAQACEVLKQEYGIDVEPVKNVKFKLEKIINFINSKYDFRYNVINTDTEYKRKDIKQWLYFDDRDYRDVKLETKMNNIQVSDEDFKTILYSRAISAEFNPFMDYFNRIGKCDSEYEYDGKGKEIKFKGVKAGRDYIKEYCDQVYLTEEKNRDYFVEGFRRWFTAYVKGLVTEQPSMYNINQTCLVLVGGQGKYKTTWLKNIVPGELQLKYFYGGTFQVHNKDHEKFLAYMMIINFDEMAALNRVEIESVKSKITQDQVIVRLPYAKADVHLKRRASFTATQNNKEFLKDDTGSRRWFVVEVDGINIVDDFDLDKMYAQGLQHYKDGLKDWFDSEDIIIQEVKNEQFQLKTFEWDLVQKHYEVPSEDDIRDSQSATVKYMSATDIMVSLSKDNNINANNTVKANIGKSLAAMGFKKVSRRKPGHKSPIPLWCVKEALDTSTRPLFNNANESTDVI